MEGQVQDLAGAIPGVEMNAPLPRGRHFWKRLGFGGFEWVPAWFVGF